MRFIWKIHVSTVQFCPPAPSFSILKLETLKTASDLEEAFKKWNQTLFRYAYARLGKREIAEEITQEAFIKAWRYRDSFDPQKSPLKSWLFTITINTLRDYFRKNKNRREDQLNENIRDNTNLSQESEKKDTSDFIFRQIRKLKERDQTILILHYREDFTLEEISRIMGLRYSATKTAIHRALKKLKSLCNDVTEDPNSLY